MLRRTAALDWIGAALNLGAVTSLVLGLQWGGNEKAWNSADVIVVCIPSVSHSWKARWLTRTSASFLHPCWLLHSSFGSAIWEIGLWFRWPSSRGASPFTRSAPSRSSTASSTWSSPTCVSSQSRLWGSHWRSSIVYSCVVFQLHRPRTSSADHSIQPSITRQAATILRRRVVWTCSRSCCPSSSRLWCLDNSSVCVMFSVGAGRLIDFIDKQVATAATGRTLSADRWLAPSALD